MASRRGSLSGPMSAAGLPVRKGSMITRLPSRSKTKQACPWNVAFTRRYALRTRSISASESDIPRNRRVRGMSLSLADMLRVRIRAQQPLQFFGVLDLHLDHPALAVGVAVHQGGVLL